MIDPFPLETEFRPEVIPDTAVVELRGRATYREAPELRRQLFAAIAAGGEGNLVVELGQVEKMDTAAMAVLVEALLATRERGPKLYFCSPSESVRKVFRLTGLEEALSRCYGCLDELRRTIGGLAPERCPEMNFLASADPRSPNGD